MATNTPASDIDSSSLSESTDTSPLKTTVTTHIPLSSPKAPLPSKKQIPRSQPHPPSFIGIVPTNTLLSPSDYHASSTVTTPSGIIPLPSPGHAHPLHITTSQPTPVSTHLALPSLTQRFPAASLIRMTLSTSNPVVQATPTITSPSLIIPDAPPPPYPIAESISDEFGCSSPSQFLHSPTSVQTSTTAFDDLKDGQDSHVPPLSVTVTTTATTTSTTANDDIIKLRSRLVTKRKSQMTELKENYESLLQEKFFLEGGGNMMEYIAWKKKPNILKDQYMKQHDLDSETPAFDELLSPKYPSQSSEKMDTETILEQESLDFDTVPKSASSFKSNKDTPHHLSLPPPSTSSGIPVLTPNSAATSPSRSLSLSSPRHLLRSHSTLSVTEVSHEDIVMRARHEAEVMKAIAELRREGLWSSSRLPKVQEPLRIKTHWDYLLEEMQWLATDFANERRWKMNAAKKLSRTVSRHQQERELSEQKAQKDEQQKLRKIASTMAKEVKHFWDSIQKIVEHKQQSVIEEKRRKAIDMHLNFIVDQTQKYSSWLMKGMTTATPTDPSLTSTASNDMNDSDDLFCPSVDNDEHSDDEETINKEESLAKETGDVDYTSELQQLEKEGEMPIEDLLASLPPELLEEHGRDTSPVSMEEDKEVEEEEEEKREKKTSRKRPRDELSEDEDDISPSKAKSSRVGDSDDGDYAGSDEEGEMDDEGTIEEQEQFEDQTTDYGAEMDALEKEGDMPIEDLLKMYQQSRESATPDDSECIKLEERDSEERDQEEEELEESGNESRNESGNESENESENESGNESSEDPGLELLVSGKTVQEACQTEQGLSDVAAAAEQLQPKGITLSTTEVKTKVPFLLRHTLREYQHIGLDWLVTMHEKHLNGILADEMGLGKTIQTIALLAHLACDKGNWGPHLIIVPTSVMLNWEYELKKWCPGFKILTYFGSFKERKQKRVGWSKQNAFHICITSYNIAVQDNRSFKQKKWKYLILDEAQNIKNFKSQRWQTLLTFNSQHRLLLTGTPLQNNLMELWSLMHFLMPTVFSSHSDFKEWFSNPLTGMVEGSQDYNESIIQRLHKVLRPFLLRRLKSEVEKQLPKKYEHLVLCRLSKRQRFLYEEYMSRTKTKETLVTGNYMSVINVLMQLRKVCNHPDLFEPRRVFSPFRMLGIAYTTASLVLTPLAYNPFKHVSLNYLNLCLSDYELHLNSFTVYRSRQLQAPRSSLVDTESFIRGETIAKLNEEDEDEHMGDEDMDDLADLTLKEKEWVKSQKEHLHEVNTFHCRKQPVYGRDLVQTIRGMVLSTHAQSTTPPTQYNWLHSGHYNCLIQQLFPSNVTTLCITQPLTDMLCSYDRRSCTMHPILRRFVIAVPMATSPSITFHVSHPHPSDFAANNDKQSKLNKFVNSSNSLFHEVDTYMSLQFPETRLIQYDCGKLQTLSELLRKLKVEGHRVLVFTQMARMLDVLEIFLNYHGYTYLRLDGATPITKRQLLMDRFNRDPRLFCFILSTRSGGLGVNLTGADTVIFYDSDWNPTMDAQAQDRCHRIGQTRDVHIYRLICESTVEENILKKANQKRMLGNIAIDSGAFTTEFFKQSNLKDLFSVDSSQAVDVVPQQSSNENQDKDSKMSQKQLEEILLQAEEERDVAAAKMAREEASTDLAEFDEHYNSMQNNSTTEEYHDAESSRALQEFALLEEQLSGIEKYMIKFLENENAEVAAQQIKQTEEDIQQAKKDWEFSHLQQLREQEEKMAREEEEREEAMCLTYDRPEIINKVIIEEHTGEEMHIWLPPTPPADSQPDYYLDYTLEMAYDTSSLMTPDELLSTAIYSEDDFDVFGLYKPPHETFSEPLKKLQKAPAKFKREHTNIPQSLFWRRYTPDLLTTRIRKLSPQTKKVKGKAEQFTPLLDSQDGPDWLSTEDWILIKGLTATLEFPLSLNCTVPAQTPNWSILADLVSTYSKTKRSPLQCKDHLVGVVIPREEQITRNEDPESKKHKSREAGQIKKYKNRRDQKTRTMVVQDKCRETTKQFGSCFHWIHMSSDKRRNQNKQNVNESVSRSSLHSELLLKEYDVNLDTVCSPMFLAQARAERIQSEMPRNPQVHQLLTQPQQQQQQQQQPQAPPYAHLTQITRQLSANLKTTVTTGSGNNTGTHTWPTTTPVPTTEQKKTTTCATTSVQSTVAMTTTAAATVATTTETPLIPTPIPSMPVTVKPLQTTPQSLPLSVTSIGGGTTPQATTAGMASTPHSVTTPTTSSSISNAAAAAAAAAVAKTYSGVDLNKGILLNHRLTPQQILLLRQTALQHQQQLQKQQQAVVAAGLATPTTQVQRHVPQIVSTSTIKQSQPVQLTTCTAQTGQSTPTIQTQPTLAKIQIPGIEQLRPTIALSNQRGQGALVRAAGLPARSMQTEEVLALLRQQHALRMAMQTQTAKLAAQQQLSQATHHQQSQSQQQPMVVSTNSTTMATSTHQTPTTTTGLSEAIAAAALAAAAVQQQQQQQQQLTSKQQSSSKQPQQASKQQQPSIVSPAVKSTEQAVSLIEANQLKVELIERSQPTSKQK